MTEGADVRRAYDGPDIEHDKLLGKIEQHNREDAERASSAAGTRSDIGAFLDDTGLNKKAYSQLRQIAKVGDKSQDQAMDIIRSLKKGLPMLEAHISGQEELDFDGGNVTDEGSADDQDDVDLGGDDVEDGQTDEETEEFNQQVDDVVTPIDFGGASAG